jgi:hypothetical protein
LLRSVARLKWRTRESLTCFAAAIRFIELSRQIMDQIDLAPLTLRFLARVQLLRESTQLFRSAPHLPHDTSYFCGGQCISAVDEPRKRPHCLMCLGYGGDKNIKITNALSRECWTRSLRVTAHRHVSSGVAPCQSEILSLKKAVWRLWLVSKSRTKSSAEGCEPLLRRAANIARLPSSPSHARTARRRLQATREIPPAIRHRRILAQLPVNSSREGTTPVEGGLSSGILLECFLGGRTNLRSSSIQLDRAA